MKSIQRNMTAWLMVALLCLATLANAFFYFRVRTALRREYDRRLVSDARALSRLIAFDEKGRMELEIPKRELPEFEASDRPAYFEVWQKDGTLFFRSPSLGKGDLRVENGSVAWDTRLPDGRFGRATEFKFMPHLETDEPPVGGEAAPKQEVAPSGEALVVLAYDVDDMRSFLGYLLIWQAIGTVALSLICAGLMNRLVRRGLRPLHELGEEAAKFDPDRLNVRFRTTDMPKELTPIVERLNDLLGRISRTFERERRFTANAAHELRTPIAELRTCAEVALKSLERQVQSTADSRQDFEEILAIAHQMEYLTRTLLSIARNGHPDVAKIEPVQLREVVQVVKARHESVAVARRLRLLCVSVGDAGVMTDRTMLEALLQNLLSNAVSYAPEGTEIRLTARAVRDAPWVEVENEAPDLAESDLPRLFEPFWRSDIAHTAGEHAGLGLTMAEAYARALGLRLKASLGSGHVFRVMLEPTET